jgi:hypothetical protein
VDTQKPAKVETKPVQKPAEPKATTVTPVTKKPEIVVPTIEIKKPEPVKETPKVSEFSRNFLNIFKKEEPKPKEPEKKVHFNYSQKILRIPA